MEFSRQEYWSGCHFLLQGDLPDPGIKPTSLPSPALAGRFLITSATREVPCRFLKGIQQRVTQVAYLHLLNWTFYTHYSIKVLFCFPLGDWTRCIHACWGGSL